MRYRTCYSLISGWRVGVSGVFLYKGTIQTNILTYMYIIVKIFLYFYVLFQLMEINKTIFGEKIFYILFQLIKN